MPPESRLPSSNATSVFTGSFELEDETKTLEDYVVGQRLGEGAYGSVYVVKYIPSGDRFALKILQKQDLFTGSGIYSPLLFSGNEDGKEQKQQQLDGAAEGPGPLDIATAATASHAPSAAAALVRSFEQNIVSEAMVMQSLAHPHVVKFYKFLNSTTAFYFVLELAEGGELFDLILSKKYFTEDEARMYFQQLISAIDYCHRNGVAHKDLKAENLLLSNDGRLLVCDFGFSSKVAKENIDDPEETVGTGDNIALLDAIHNGSMFGTLHYTSPEAVLASAQQRGCDYLSGDDSDGSTRNDGTLPSQANMVPHSGGAGICSSSSPVSTSSSDSPTSSRSGSTRTRRGRKHPALSRTGTTLEGGIGVSSHSPRSTCATSLVQPSDAASLARVTLEVAVSYAPKGREGRTQPIPLSPPPVVGGGNMRHSTSTQSLGSLTSDNGKSHKKTSPTLVRNKVGEGFSSFVKALLGAGSASSNGGHHHHNHHQPHPDTLGQASSQRGKLGLQRAPTSTVVSSTRNGKATLGAPRVPLGGHGEGVGKTSEAKHTTGSPHSLLRVGSSSQEPVSVLSSAVSSSSTSPMTLSFQTNPSFADSTGRTVASAAAAPAATRRGMLPLSSVPTTRVTSPASVAAPTSTRARVTHKESNDVAFATKRSTEELSARMPSSREAGAAHTHQRLPLTTEPDSASGLAPTGYSSSSPFPASPAPRRPPLVIVDPFQQDLWSAGVILFFMLTGRLPFDGRDEEETLHLIQTNNFAFDEDEVQRISPAARQLVTQMLAAEPTERPTTEQIIHNPWFQVGIQIQKDFPHRKDLLETLSRPLGNRLQRVPTSLQVMVDEASGSPASQAESGGHSNEESTEVNVARLATEIAENSSITLHGSTVASAARQRRLLASHEGTSVTPASPLGSVAHPAGGGVVLSSSNHSSAPGLRHDEPASFTFLDFSTQHPVTVEEERVLAAAFRKVDTDGFGCITRDQLRDMLTTLHGDAVPTSDVDELVWLFTGDAKAEHITFKQFRDAWVTKDLAHVPFTHSSEFQLANIIGTEMDVMERQVVRQLRAAFDSLDENHRGVIQLDQIRRVFEKCRIPVQQDDCLSLIKYFHETEMARCNTRASKNWHRWRVTPAVTPNTTHPTSTSDTASPVQSPPAAPLSSPEAPASSCSPAASTKGSSLPHPQLRVAKKDRVCKAEGRAVDTAATAEATAAPTSNVARQTSEPLLVRSGASPPNDSLTSPSSITVSFDSFASGIVKSDILMKHPLGRKLAAATNLAAMFQSRNVTECVRHGFLVTGLQNVILAKLASMPERLLLLYSDEVVSNTENIYSFRYLGSSALMAGATMSSATPLLMSASLVAMAASTGHLSGTGCGNSAQHTPGRHSGSSVSHRSMTTSPASSTHQRGRLNSAFDSLQQSQSGAGVVTTPSAVTDTLGRDEKAYANSNAGSLPYNSAPTVADVNMLLSRSGKPDVRKPPSQNTLARSDFFDCPNLPHDGGAGDPFASSSATSQPSPPQRSAPVPIPRPPSRRSSAATPSRAAASIAGITSGLTPSNSHSQRYFANSGTVASVVSTGGGRDRHLHSAENDDDSAQDDTQSFFTASRDSSSIINTSEDAQSASDGTFSSVQLEEYEGPAPTTVQARRRKSANTTVAPNNVKKAAHSKFDARHINPPTAARDTPMSAKETNIKRKLTTPQRQSTVSEAAAYPSSAVVPETSAPMSASRHGNGATSTTTNKRNAAPAAPVAALAGAESSNAARVALASSLPSLPSTTNTNAGYSLTAAPSTSFTHRAMAYGGTGAVPQVNGVCDVDVILSPACFGYTMVQFRRIHGKTSDFHESVTFISNLLESEREQAMEDTLTCGESELM